MGSIYCKSNQKRRIKASTPTPVRKLKLDRGLIFQSDIDPKHTSKST